MVRSSVVLLALVALIVACGGDGEAPPRPLPTAEIANPPSELIAFPSTATPWPTFTPLPSPTPTAAPTPGPTGDDFVSLDSRDRLVFTPTPRPTAFLDISATLEPSVLALLTPVPFSENPSVAGVPVSTPVLTPFPTRPPSTPFGRVDTSGEGAAVFAAQSLFPVQGVDVPVGRLTGYIEDLPRSYRFIGQGTTMVVWAVIYDVSSVPEGWSMEGTVRWYDVSEGYEPLLMVQGPVALSSSAFMFWQGLRGEAGGLWQPGDYRVELLDESLEVVLFWEFEVR